MSATKQFTETPQGIVEPRLARAGWYTPELLPDFTFTALDHELKSTTSRI